MRNTRLCLALVGLGLLFGVGAPSYAVAEDAPADLVRLGEASTAAELVGVSQSGELQFKTASGEAILTRPDELVRWSTPALLTAPDVLFLTDGSLLRLQSSWTGKPSVVLHGDTAQAATQQLGRLAVPRTMLRAVCWRLPPDAQSRDQQVNELISALADDAKSDVVLLDNGDLMRGKVVGLGAEPSNDEGGSIVQVDGPLGEMAIPVAQVRGIAFAQASLPSKEVTSDLRLTVGLRDGSVIAATSMTDKDDKVSLRSDAVGETSVRLEDLASLQAASRGVVYLSDLKPVDYRHEPFLELDWPYKRDRNVRGGTGTVGGRRYLKAVGMHSASRLTFDLKDGYDRFAASIAIDDAAEGAGSVVFRVQLNRHGKWHEAYASEVVRGGEPPREVAVDLEGAEQLALEVDYADRGDERDYANWLDARLERIGDRP